MKQNGLKKKNMGYMGGGGTMMPTAPVSSMYRMGGKLYMGGGKTMDNTMSYKDDVQKKFGGGGMTEPAMKKNKTKGMAKGGMFGSRPIKPKNPSIPGSINNKINKFRNRNPDPILPRGKKGKGDI